MDKEKTLEMISTYFDEDDFIMEVASQAMHHIMTGKVVSISQYVLSAHGEKELHEKMALVLSVAGLIHTNKTAVMRNAILSEIEEIDILPHEFDEKAVFGFLYGIGKATFADLFAQVYESDLSVGEKLFTIEHAAAISVKNFEER